VWLAHCVHLNEHEINTFAYTRTSVAHCPSSNFRLGSGIAPFVGCWMPASAWGWVSTAPASNDSSNMLAEARQALLAHRLADDASKWLTAREVLWMATRGGARCLGRDDIGSLEPGKAADVIAIDTRRLSYAGAGSDILAAIVFSPWPQPVDFAMVNGRIVVESGALVGVDVPGPDRARRPHLGHAAGAGLAQDRQGLLQAPLMLAEASAATTGPTASRRRSSSARRE
jgi:cytosine/adenosine deaminase-related metal-dependent hydrolase